MKTKYVWILLTIAALITIYGVLSGKFFFLFFMLPLGFGLFKRKDKDEDM
ncbi:hypothetical protein [Gelidibacter pelagius]|uniref:Uncharacterized protein n=1 Tax=Gelidibacter pelagius TaxID=2819985 RepID=A0ABS3SW90_9FLAO|nr:hypothetical protein [Gelidibacter pelagius]MBO3099173.1 hypothetical protein [Gelidibacter pelagius]